VVDARQPQRPVYVTVTRFAQLTSLGRSSVYRLIREGKPVCQWHSQIHAQFGVFQAPPKTKRRAVVEEIADDEASGDLAAIGFDAGSFEAAMGTLRQRLTGTGQAYFGDIEAVFRDGLKAKKVTQVTCPHCAKRFRHYLIDLTVRLATAKLILDKLVSPSGGGEDDEPRFDASLGVEEMSTEQVRALAFPTREDLDEALSPEHNPASRADWVAGVHRRHRQGFHVGDTELEEATEALREMQRLRTECDSFMRSTEAISGLSFGRAA
jgi:hypothetical protein